MTRSALFILMLALTPAVAGGQAPRFEWRNVRTGQVMTALDVAPCDSVANLAANRAAAARFRCFRERGWRRIEHVSKRDCPIAVFSFDRTGPKHSDSSQVRALPPRISAEIARRWLPSRDDTAGTTSILVEGRAAYGFVVTPYRSASSTIEEAAGFIFEADTATIGGNGGHPVIDAGNDSDMPTMLGHVRYDPACSDIRRADDPADSSVVEIARTHTYFEYQTMPHARLLDTLARPAYPDMLRAASVEGEVLAQFVVDTLGRVEIGSFKVLKTTHDLFTNAVRRLLPSLHFAPAEANGGKVRQLVQMPFPFKLPR